MRVNEDHTRIRIGISSCLLGEKVRFDGNHKHDRYITDTLGRCFDFVPMCPEAAVGLGVPREPIRLVGDAATPRAVGVRSAHDVTDKLVRYGKKAAAGRRLAGISGYILKSKSPSCGMERVKIYSDKGSPYATGSGLYAREIMAANPLLPVEEEGRLGDPGLRENFLERVFAYHRWQQLDKRGITAARLVEFHTAHKLVLMAHGTEHYRALGRLVAGAGETPIGRLAADYIAGFMQALKHQATAKRHANVLMHAMGYLKRQLDADDKAELLALIDAQRTGQLPLIVPLTLLRHHFRRHPDTYIAKQLYLYPDPLQVRCGV